MNLLVLSSSRGTTFQAVIDAMKGGTLSMKCLGLVTDSADRGCIEKAKAAGLPYVVAEKVQEGSREEQEKHVEEAMKNLGASSSETIIAALGWMHILSASFIHRWKNRIINVHPALLPKYGGEGMYGDRVHQAVLDAKEKESGITIHLMDEGVDTGKILLQKTCPVLPDDTVESLKARVQALEREWYPKVLEMIATREIDL